jgi:hypothetical protein
MESHGCISGKTLSMKALFLFVMEKKNNLYLEKRSNEVSYALLSLSWQNVNRGLMCSCDIQMLLVKIADLNIR